MVDWTSPAVNGRAVMTIQAEIFICMGIFFADNVRFARFDLSLIRGRRSHRFAQIPYFASKLFWWSYIVSCLVFLYTYTEIDCNTVMAWIEAQMGWVAVSSSALLAFRAVCVFTGRAKTVVSITLAILTAGVLAAWMAGVKDVLAVWLPGEGPVWVDGQCSYVSVRQVYMIKYLLTTAYDLVVLVLTVYGLTRFKGGLSGRQWMGQLLVEQGLIYFVATLVANIFVTAWTLANVSPTMSLIGAVPSSLVCVMCSTRLYAQLAEDVSMRNQYGSAGLSSFNSLKARMTGGASSSGFGTSSTGKQASKGPTVIMLKSVDNASTCNGEEGGAAHFKKVDANNASTDDIEAQHRTGPQHPTNGIWIEEETHHSVSESY